jgi:hypothetical protein
MAPTSLTLDYGALLSTSVFNYAKTLVDNISKSNAVLNMLKKNDFYELIEDIGERAQIALMYALTLPHVYAGYDELDATPQEGITSAFSNWAQIQAPISISGEEKLKNKGEAKIISLIESKLQQTEVGMQDFMDRIILQGNGPNLATAIDTGYVDPTTGRVGIDPLPKLVDFTPAVGSVQGIDPATDTWWRNQTTTDTSTTFAGFLTVLDNMWNKCSKGPGGGPDFHLTDQTSFEVYKAALRSQNRFTEYTKADLPFTNIALNGSPIAWDEYTPDVSGGTITQTNTSGSWYMLNSKFMRMKVASERNFNQTEFREPVRQDATVAYILWMGALMLNNRRKHGVIGSVDGTLTS